MNRQKHSKVRNGIGSYVTGEGEKRYRVVLKVEGQTKSKGGFTTKGAAEAHRNSQRADVQRGLWIDPAKGRLAFGVFAEEWLAGARLSQTTRSRYRHLLDHELAVWTNVPLANITQTAVRQWVGKLRATPGTRTKRLPAEASVLKAYRLLQRITNIAVKEGLLVASPCKEEFKNESPTLHVPTKDEIMAIANAVPDRYRALVLLAGFGGLRWGEAIGLCRRHVDLVAGSVNVEQTVIEVLGNIEVKAHPKTEAGRRVVYLPALVREALALHITKWSESGPNGLVFGSVRSKSGPAYVRRSNFYRRVWRPTVTALGLPDVRFHDLRHAAATLAAQGGYTTRELMHHIGHASAAASLRYQHAADDRMRSLPRSIDALIGEPAAATGTDNVVPLRKRT